MSERSVRIERVRVAVNWTALAILTALGCMVLVSAGNPGSTTALMVGLVLAVPVTRWLGTRWLRHRLR